MGCDAQRTDGACDCKLLSEKLFRTGVIRGHQALTLPGVRKVAWYEPRNQRSVDSAVNELDYALRRHKHVGRLNVAVNDELAKN